MTKTNKYNINFIKVVAYFTLLGVGQNYPICKLFALKISWKPEK